MQVKNSKYLADNKGLFRKLLDKLLAKYEYASVMAVDSIGKNYRVTKTGTTVMESELLTKRGYVVKVYDGHCYAEYSSNVICESCIDEIVEFVENHLMPIGTSMKEGLSCAEYKMPSDEKTVFCKSTDYEKDPEELGDNKIVEMLTAIKDKGMKYDEKVLDCFAVSSYQKYSKIFLSRNKDMEQNVMWATGFLMVNTIRGEEVKQYFTTFSKLGGMEVLDDMMAAVDNTAKVAIELLDSEPMIPGEYDCICTPDATGMIVHEAFGHGVEMDMFVKDRALAKKYIGEYVASPLITMHDGNAVDQTATYFFDDEGTMASDTVIIDKGILVQGMSDLQSAMVLGTVPTGNGRRESFERKAYTRMTNTYFEPGTDKLEDMIASIKDGFLLENPSSGMEDPKNWGIQCMVNMAREIKDGKFTGKIYSPIVLTGYVPDLLKSITMVSDQIELSGSGFCGKGYKEWAKVSDGGPYIKARIRLG